jgi:hypothetical protein
LNQFIRVETGALLPGPTCQPPRAPPLPPGHRAPRVSAAPTQLSITGPRSPSLHVTLDRTPPPLFLPHARADLSSPSLPLPPSVQVAKSSTTARLPFSRQSPKPPEPSATSPAAIPRYRLEQPSSVELSGVVLPFHHQAEQAPEPRRRRRRSLSSWS